MQTVEQISKIISYLMALTAIPTLAITIGRYYYDKRKDSIESRIKLGYLPLYEHFYYKDTIREVQNKTKIITYPKMDTLYNLLQNKVDKLVLPLKLATLIIQYETCIEIANTSMSYLNRGRTYSEENQLMEYVDEVDEFYREIQNEICSEVAVDMEDEIEEDEELDENFPNEYFNIIKESLKKANTIEGQIKKFVNKKIITDYKHRN